MYVCTYVPSIILRDTYELEEHVISVGSKDKLSF